MPVAPSDIPTLITAGVKTAFQEAFNSSSALWSDIATRVDSTLPIETYGWLGANPRMREFVDERLIAALRENKYTITNKTWEATIGVKAEAIEDDRYGQIRLRSEMLAEDAGRHIDELLFAAIEAGNSTACYDGANFFSASHSEAESGTMGNLGSLAFSSTNLKATISAMRRFKDDRGRPIRVNPTHIVSGPELEWDVKEVLNSTYYPDTVSNGNKGANNVMKGALTQIVSQDIADTNDWYVFDCSNRLKPFIVQIRKDIEFTSLTKDSDTGFMRDEFLFGVRGRYNVGYGLWQYAYAQKPA